jgi:hypothetical protein
MIYTYLPGTTVVTVNIAVAVLVSVRVSSIIMSTITT